MNQVNYFKRNIILLQILSALKGFVFFYTVIYILFLQVYIDSFTQISILLIMPIVVSLLFQYPTGIFADKFGRVTAIKIGFLCYGFCLLLFLLTTSFMGLAVALIFFTLGHSFISGSEESLLFESLRKIDLEVKFDYYLARLNIYFVGVGIITNFLAPYLFSINILYPFFVSFIFLIFTFSLSFLLKETLYWNNCLENLTINKKKSLNYFFFDMNLLLNPFKKPFLIIISSSYFIFLLFFSILFSSLIGVFGDLFNQPLINLRFGLELYGIIFALATVVQTALLYFTDKYFSFFKEKIYLALILIWLLNLYLTLIMNWQFVIFSMGIMWLVGSLTYILVSKKIQNLVKDDSKRASVHSLFMTINSFFTIIVLYVSGLLIDSSSLITSLIYISSFIFFLIFLVMVLFTFLIYKSQVEY